MKPILNGASEGMRWQVRSSVLARCLALAGLLLPFAASANAGTPLMWAGMLHLVFGNAIIGVAEGLLIALAFKRPKLLCIALLVGANYCSAWLGGVGIANWVAASLAWELYNAWRQFWLLAALTFGLTLLLEWPFVAACFWKQQRWVRRSVAALLLTQIISYVCLFGWYWGASGKSLYTRMQIVQASDMTLPKLVTLYYVQAKDGRIHQHNLENSADETMGEVVSANLQDRLLYGPQVDGASEEYLCLRRDAANNEEVVLVPITDMRGRLIRNPTPNPESPGEEKGRETWFNFGDALEVGEAVHSDWHISTGFWPIEGLRVENDAADIRYRFAWETPFSSWYIRNAIHLPDDRVIFQLGEDQVCILDPETRQIALLVKGRGPAVALQTGE